jgi:cytochrome P450
MSSAGFGKSYYFRGAKEKVTSKDSSSSKDALKLILDNCIPLVVLGPNNLDKRWLPKSWKASHQSTITFRNYMTSVYEEENKVVGHGKKEGNNLMTSLVRASQGVSQSEASGESTPQVQNGLTEQKVYGNMFVFNFAGHDTTANALTFGIALIAHTLMCKTGFQKK